MKTTTYKSTLALIFLASTILASLVYAESSVDIDTKKSNLSLTDDACYFFVWTTLDRTTVQNNRWSNSYLVSNVVSARCYGSRDGILVQFNEAVRADGRYNDAKFARNMRGPFRDRQEAMREHRKAIGDWRSSNHRVTNFSFSYYRQ